MTTKKQSEGPVEAYFSGYKAGWDDGRVALHAEIASLRRVIADLHHKLAKAKERSSK